MAEKNVSVRLVATGGGQVRAELTQIGAAGDAALKQVGVSADSASKGLGRVRNAAKDAGDAAGAMGSGTRMAAMQLSQMSQQTMATGNFLQALAIQLPDLTLGFGPLGIAAGVVGGVLLTLAPSLLGAGDAAEEMKDKLDAADKSTKEMVAALKLADTPLAILRQRYRDLADEIQRASGIAAGFAADQARRDVMSAARGLGGTVGDINPIRSAGLSDREWAEVQASIMDDLREKTGATADQVDLLRMALTRTGSSNSFDAVVKDGTNLLSVIGQIYQKADDAQQTYLRDWAASISAVVQVAQDQIDAETSARQRLLDTYDKTGAEMVQLTADLQAAEDQRSKALMTGMRDEVAMWDRLIKSIKQGITEAKNATYELGLAFTRTGDGFSTWFDKMRGGPLPYQQQMNQSAIATDAISLLKQFEGFSATAYDDGKRDGNGNRVGPPVWRAGFGSDTVTLADGTIQAITKGMSVSLEDANRDLQRRAIEFQNVVIRQIGQGRWGQFDQGQQASLTSIAYNYGSLPERILEAVRSGTSQDIAMAIGGLAGDNGRINQDRRLKEASPFGDTSLVTRGLAESKRLNDELKRGLDLRADFVVGLQSQASATALEAEIVGKSIYEQVRLRTEMTLTQQARAKGIDLNEKIAGSEKTYGQAIRETAHAMATAEAEQAAQEGRFKAAEDAAKKAADTMRKFQEDLQQGFSSAFQSVIDGTKSVSEAFRDMVAQMLAERAALGFGNAVSGLLGAVFGGFGGGDPLAAALTGAGVGGVQPVGGGWLGRMGAAVAQQAVHVTIGVDQRNGNLMAFTDQRVSAGLRQADRAMPARVADINRDRLKR